MSSNLGDYSHSNSIDLSDNNSAINHSQAQPWEKSTLATMDFLGSSAAQSATEKGFDPTEAKAGAQIYEKFKEDPDGAIKAAQDENFFPQEAERSLNQLMWFLEADSMRMGNHHTESMHSIPDQNSQFFNYLKALGEKSGKMYARPSTHYEGNVVGKQYGIDLSGLPGGKRTILIGEKSEGLTERSTFIKMESWGCNHAIKGMSLERIKHFLGHTGGFIRSQGQKIGLFKATKGARKEKVSRGMAKIYKRNAAAVASDSFRIEAENKKLKEVLRNDLKGGVHQMIIGLTAGDVSKLDKEGKNLLEELRELIASDPTGVKRQAKEIIHTL